MSFFDLLIMGFFFAIVLLSFLGGLDKVLSTLIGVYVGAVLAAKLYAVVATNLLAKLLPGMTSYTGELVAFLLIVLIVSVSLSVALSRNHIFQRVGKRAGVFNNLAGGILGLALAFLATIFTGMGLAVFLHLMAATGELGAGPPLSDLTLLLSDSALVPMFVKLVPFVLAPLVPFFPSGMPPLLVGG